MASICLLVASNGLPIIREESVKSFHYMRPYMFKSAVKVIKLSTGTVPIRSMPHLAWPLRAFHVLPV